MSDGKYVKGRGAQRHVKDRFSKLEYSQEHIEGIDEPFDERQKTQYLEEFPKKVLNKVESPDIPFEWSLNSYQGCEHGCIYCYARDSHNYWGYGAGLDFERKIIVKGNAPKVLREQLMSKSWKGGPIMLSGNTDAYQPIEKKRGITRKILKMLAEFRNPVGIITKNSLILRDIDILKEMADSGIVRVNISLTTLNEDLRRRMEPRTATGKERLRTIEVLSKANVPVNVMCAPLIPGLNETELPELMRHSANVGARSASYVTVRINGGVQTLFEGWVDQNYPDRKVKIFEQIRSNHGGKLNDPRFGVRMRGEGQHAKVLSQMFKMLMAKYFKGRTMPEFSKGTFRRPNSQLALFEETLGDGQ